MQAGVLAFDQIGNLVSSGGYVGIFLAMLIENFIQVIPSEAIMPLAGFLVSEGKLDFPLTCLAGTLGTIVGTLPWYYIGRTVNQQKIERYVQRHGRWFGITLAKLRQSRMWFLRYGNAIVFWGRLVPILRTLVSIPAGIELMPIRRFLLWTAFGSLLWNIFLTTSGLLLGSQWDKVHTFLKPFTIIAGFILVCLAIAYILSLRTKREV